MTKNKISVLSKVLLLAAACLLIASLFVPIWQIDLDAPQYPEGLRLLIWANAIAGDVDIINGLNHYIGMKTLHTKDFIEFTILPYIISAFALFFIVAAIVGRKKWLYTALIAFVIFGIVAMVDFWKWEYDYGHNLDPNAAIQVPGMSYQPPLIGFKQLLNFGAYSVPDIGGWLFVGAGVLLIVAIVMERRIEKKNKALPKVKTSLAMFILSIIIVSCGSDGADPIKLHKDGCDYCRMNISDGRFGAEVITQKGRVYKFDDIQCMLGYAEEKDADIKSFYIHDHSKDNKLIDATTAFYIQHPSLKSPMAGNIAAFANKADAEKFASELNVSVETWGDIYKNNSSHHEGDGHHH